MRSEYTMLELEQERAASAGGVRRARAGSAAHSTNARRTRAAGIPVRPKASPSTANTNRYTASIRRLTGRSTGSEIVSNTSRITRMVGHIQMCHRTSTRLRSMCSVRSSAVRGPSRVTCLLRFDGTGPRVGLPHNPLSRNLGSSCAVCVALRKRFNGKPSG